MLLKLYHTMRFGFGTCADYECLHYAVNFLSFQIYPR